MTHRNLMIPAILESQLFDGQLEVWTLIIQVYSDIFISDGLVVLIVPPLKVTKMST